MLYGDYVERICQYILCCICQRPIYVHIQTDMDYLSCDVSNNPQNRSFSLGIINCALTTFLR